MIKHGRARQSGSEPTASFPEVARLVASLSFDHLWTFLVLIHTGSFSSAAEELFLTQPAISQRVRHLEHMLGEKLVIRHTGTQGVALTPAGARFYEFAQEALKILVKFYCNVKNTSSRDGDKTLRVAAPAGADHLVLRLADLIGVNHHRLRVIYSSYCSDLEQAVLDDQVDAAIYPGIPTIKHLSKIPMFRQMLVFVSQSDQEFEEKLMRLLNVDKAIPFISAGKDTYLWKVSSEWAESVGLELDVVFRAHESEARKKAVLQGLGASIINAEVVRHELRRGRLRVVSLPGLPLWLPWMLVTKPGHPLGDTVCALLDLAAPLSES